MVHVDDSISRLPDNQNRKDTASRNLANIIFNIEGVEASSRKAMGKERFAWN
jgi:hypothetical protein